MYHTFCSLVVWDLGVGCSPIRRDVRQPDTIRRFVSSRSSRRFNPIRRSWHESVVMLHLQSYRRRIELNLRTELNRQTAFQKHHAHKINK